jgi:hypothetical protein
VAALIAAGAPQAQVDALNALADRMEANVAQPTP